MMLADVWQMTFNRAAGRVSSLRSSVSTTLFYEGDRMKSSGWRFAPSSSVAWLGVTLCLVGGGCHCDSGILAVHPQISVDPASIDFGQLAIGSSSGKSVEVRNVGRVPLLISGVTVADKGDVTVPTETLFVSDCMGNDRTTVVASVMSIASGDCARFDVKFAPTKAETVKTKVVIASNDPKNPSVEISVTGVGLDEPCLKVTPFPTMDFGSVTIGISHPMLLTVENCGHFPYKLTAVSLTPQTAGSKVFALAQGGTSGVPTLPLSFPPGTAKQVQVNYTPTSTAGDQATINVKTDSTASASVRVTGKGAAPGCNGLQPTANIVVEENGSPVNLSSGLLPLTTVTVDGSSSVARPGTTITQYAWTLVSAPANNTSTVGSSARFPFYLELAGDYVISLVVHSTDTIGDACSSSPATVTIHVVPPPGIHVELTWAENYGDVDLHYIGPGGALYQSPSNVPAGDLYWMYSNETLHGTTVLSSGNGMSPDWGQNNTVMPDNTSADDATLDVDQLWGKGPENVNHPKPFNGDYTVAAHYFCSRDCSGASGCGATQGPAHATLRVYVNGVQQWTGTTSLTQRDVWEAATVHVNGSTVTVVPLSKPVYKLDATGPDGLAFQACSSDGD
jgi:hypothetical protein